MRCTAFFVGLIALLSAFGALAESSDEALAQLIDRKTTRAFLAEPQPLANGEERLHLEGAAQHLTIAKLDRSGEPSAMCVGSVAQASTFLGRELRLQSPLENGENLSASAARHGLSELEFREYSTMISRAQSLAASPDRSASIAILNGDGAGEGFNSTAPRSPEGGNTATTLGAQRLAVFNRAAQIWGAFLDSNVTTQIEASFDDLNPCTSSGGVLGGAGAISLFQNFPNAPFSGTFYPAALANKIRGADGDTGRGEIQAQFNSLVDTGCLGAGTRFYYGLDNATPSGTVNLLVVVLHEMGHGLGSASYANEVTGAFANGVPDIWARFMFDSTQNRTWLQMSNAQRAQSAVGNALFWDSPSIRVASPGTLSSGRDAQNRVKLFAPSPLQQGSSVSHFDTSATPNLLMEPIITVGLPLTLDLTRQQMRDIGWFRDTNNDGIADAITNVQPSGGTVGLGTATQITWTNAGGFNKNVSIELSLDGGVSYAPITTPTQPATGVVNTGSTGSFTWNVPSNIPTTLARVRVREFDYGDLVGASSANFTVATANTAPTITLGAALSRQQGSAASAATIATVADAQTSAGSLTVSTFNVASGLLLGTPTNSAGSVSLSIAATCNASATNTFGLRVSDGSLTTESVITVSVTPNTPPNLSYSAQSVVGAGSVNVTPSATPTDNGTFGISILSTGTYQGASSINAAGVVSISNAQPAGNHTITVRALDNCNAVTDATFVLSVGVINTAPTFNSAPTIVRTQGEQNSTATSLGTVADAQTPANALVVTQIAGGSASGLTLSDLTNSSGNISGILNADCDALGGTLRLQVFDGQLSTVGTVNVEVINNLPPLLGSYAAQFMAPGGSQLVRPSSAPFDAGSIQNAGFQVDPIGFTGSVSVTAATGVVSLANVGPAGSYTVSVIIRDNCALGALRSFALTVDPDRLYANGFE